MKSCCSIKNLSPKDFFLTLLGVTFGLWLMWVGLSKWIFFGPTGFLGYIQSDFAKTFLPPVLITFTGWVILIAEPLLGFLLLLSRGRCRLCWLMTTALLFMLLIGKTITGDYQTISYIWHYLVLAIVAGAFAGSCCESSSCSSSKCCDESKCCSDDKAEDCCKDEKKEGCCGGESTKKDSGCCSK